MRAADDICIRLKSELNEILNDVYVVQRVNIQQLRCFGHDVRMEEHAPMRWVFDAEICGEEDDLVSVRRTKWRNNYHRLM